MLFDTYGLMKIKRCLTDKSDFQLDNFAEVEQKNSRLQRR